MGRTVPATLDGKRLDRVLMALFLLTPQRASELIAQGAVFVGRRRARHGTQRVRAGQLVRTDPDYVPPPVPSLTDRVLLVDEALLVLDKPAGMPTGPTLSAAAGTLLFEARRQRLCSFQPCEVHRLDALTSGVVAFVRPGAALRNLMEQFRQGQVHKRYLCRVHGTAPGAVFVSRAPLRQDPRRPQRVLALPEGPTPAGARAAETHFGLLAQGPGYCDLEARPRTGRTHQIRVHLSALGLPVWGDPIYGNPALDRQQAPGRLWLHAAELAFRHPVSGRPVVVRAELPPDMAGFAAA